MNKNPYPGMKRLRDQPDHEEHEKKLMEAKADLAGQMGVWCDKHNLTKADALALCAYMTGAAIANQDQRIMTGDMAMQIVIANIEAGNKMVIDELINKTEGTA